jgi:VCBS repeat-containing protein
MATIIKSGKMYFFFLTAFFLIVSFSGIYAVAPVITDSKPAAVTCDEDNTPTAFSLTLHATDADLGDVITWSVSTPASHGTAGASGTGTSKAITYSPTANYYGPDSFIVTVSDGTGGTDNITVNVTISPLGDTPSVTNATTNEDIQTTSGLVISRNVNDGSEITSFKISNIQNGVLYQNNGTSVISEGQFITFAMANAGLKFTPSLNSTASGSFDVEPSLNGTTVSLQGSKATATITVNAVNDAPVITEGATASVTCSEDNSPTAFSLTLNVTDVEGNTITWSVSSAASHGTAIATGTGTSKAISYIPAANYNGSDSFIVTVSDGNGGTDDITVNVTISAVNDAPVITEGGTTSVTCSEDNSPTAFSLTLNATDADGNTITWSVSSLASHGTATASGTGTSKAISYIPTANYNGSDSFVITVSDGNGGTDNITVNVTISAVNDAPVLTEPSDVIVPFTEDGGSVRITSTLTVADVDDTNLETATVVISGGLQSAEDVLSFTPSGGITGSYTASTGTLALSGSSSLINYQTVLQSVRYNNTSQNPNTSLRTLSFTVNDGSANSNTVTRNVSVTAVNDPPVATNVQFNPVSEYIGVTRTGTFTYTDPEGNPAGTHTYQWYRAVLSNGSDAVAIAGATSLTYKPTKTDGQKYICFEVTLKDNQGGVGTPVKSNFYYINALPVASNAYIYGTSLEPGQTIRGRFTYSDAEGNPRGNAIYKWYRSNTASPTPSSPGTEIGTDSTYKLKTPDAGKYIWFKVKPVATSGSTPGDSIWSTVSGQIGDFTAAITGSASYCPGTTMPVTLTISAGVSPYTAVITRSGSTLNKDTTISNITSSPRVIQVKVAGTYTIKSLTDDDGNTATITGSPVVLVYYPRAKATLSGTQQICNDGTSKATLSLNFSVGTSPWTVTIRRRENASYDTTFTGVTSDPFYFDARVIGTTATRHRVISITDIHGCVGDTASGSAWVSYNPNSPTARISGSAIICPGSSDTITVRLTGPSPWSITYQINGTNPTTINNITNTLYGLTVTQSGTYTLTRVANTCTGKVSGSATVSQYTPPTATISGSATICEYTTTNLNVALTGSSPWMFSYRKDGGTNVLVENITSSPKTIPVSQAGIYTLYEVFDKNCKGSVSGSAVIAVTPAPDVSISGLASAYNKDDQQFVTITGTPSGGTFSGSTGLFYSSPNWLFLPRYAAVGINNIVYSYRVSPSSCWGYDTAVVRVLETDAEINYENGRNKFCKNDKPFLVTGSNIANDTGSFSITGGLWLVDHGDNTATVNVAKLNPGTYTVTYTYTYFETEFHVTKNFDVGIAPTASFKWESECFQTGQPINFTNTSTSTFGILTDTSYHWKVYKATGYDSYSTRNIVYTFPQTSNYTLDMWIINTYGCSDTITKVFPLRPVIALGGQTYFEDFETSPVSWRSGTDPSITVNSWRLGDPSKGFTDPSSGTKCWYTYVPSYPAPREQSWVTSPCFDFTGTQKPMLKMDIWRLFNANRDGANIQASADSGKNWMRIGNIGDGIKWYNSTNILGTPGGSETGWSNEFSNGNDTYWVEARHALDMLKGKTRVQFRIAYGSNGTAYNNNGIAFDDVFIGERNRTALIEHFTNSSDADSKDANATLNAFVNANDLSAIDLQYHTSSPSGDPFYADNPVVPGVRQSYYGLTSVPYSVLDGGTANQYRFDYIEGSKPFNGNTILVQSLLDSKFWINLNSKVSGNTLTVSAEVVALENMAAADRTVHIAVIERLIDNETGSNGETSFESVVKAFLPDAAGTLIDGSWTKSQSRFIEQSWDLQNVYDPTELRVVAFIQNEATSEVYQASKDTIGVLSGIHDPGSEWSGDRSFVLYPNPAQRTAYIRFFDMPEKDLVLEIYNNLGRLIQKQTISDGRDITEISLEKYPDGVYIVRILSRNKLMGIRKLIVTD